MKNEINKIEALVDSISFLNSYYKADSISYKLRNPLLLRSFSKPGRHEIDDNGYRVFTTSIGGYKSSYWDVEKKLSGTSNTGLQPTDKLKNLLAVYGVNEEQDVLTVVYFLRKAIDPTISSSTPLSYFKEN